MRDHVSSFAALLAASLFYTPAHADGFLAERLHPAVTAGGYITTERPETSGHLALRGGVLFSYQRNPLIATAGPVSSELVRHAVSAEASAALGLWRFGELALSVPAMLYQAGEGPVAPAALGDLRLHLKARLFSVRSFGLGLLGTVSFPTGDSQAFAGTGQVAFAPRLLLEGRGGWLRGGLNAGVLVRRTGEYGASTSSHELTFSGALSLRPHAAVEIIGEVHGATALLAPFQERDQSPLEALAALALHLGPVTLSAGAGAGLVAGAGAPAWRTFVGLGLLRERPLPPRRVLVAPPRPLPPPAEAPDAPDETPQAPPSVELAAPYEEETGTAPEGVVEIEVTTTQLIPSQAIFFELNQHRVRSRFAPSIDAMAELVIGHPEFGTIHIEGHTDASGSAEYNRKLSLRRAQAVCEALARRGVPLSRLIPAGYGSERPIASNDDETGREKNRRVIFYYHR